MIKLRNFDDYKFRCSSLGKLMTTRKGGGYLSEKEENELEALSYKRAIGGATPNQITKLGELEDKKKREPELSQTTKTYLYDLVIAELFGRTKVIHSKYLEKGTIVENEARKLYSKVMGRTFYKNQKRYENEFISGMPDNVTDIVRDWKSSWDLTTFPLFNPILKSKMDHWQVVGYMDLTGCKAAKVVKILVDTPEHLIVDELYSRARALNMIDCPPDLEDEIRKEMTFSDIPAKYRVKEYDIERKDYEIQALHERVVQCRAYMNKLVDGLKAR